MTNRPSAVVQTVFEWVATHYVVRNRVYRLVRAAADIIIVLLSELAVDYLIGLFQHDLVLKQVIQHLMHGLYPVILGQHKLLLLLYFMLHFFQ